MRTVILCTTAGWKESFPSSAWAELPPGNYHIKEECDLPSVHW